MGVVGRLDQYASMLATEFDETTANNPSITGLGTYYASEFSENVGITTALDANIFPPYDIVYDEFGGTLFGVGQGRYMRQNTDKSVIVYNEIDEITMFNDFWLLGEQDSGFSFVPGSAGTFTSANITATSGGNSTLSFTFIETTLNCIGNVSYIRLYKNSSQIFQFNRSSGLTTTYSVSYNFGDVFYFQVNLDVTPYGSSSTDVIRVNKESSLVYEYTQTTLDI
jgi:hypothetical protein